MSIDKRIKGNFIGIKWSLFCQIWSLWSGDTIFFAEQGRIVFAHFCYFCVQPGLMLI